jgi:hypothetical protein
MIHPLLSNIEVYFFILFAISVVIGYIICHFIVVPILLKKHGKKSFYESMVWEAPQAVNRLRDLAKETNDKSVLTTLKIIKYSKYLMALFFILFVLSTFLSNFK